MRDLNEKTKKLSFCFSEDEQQKIEEALLEIGRPFSNLTIHDCERYCSEKTVSFEELRDKCLADVFDDDGDCWFRSYLFVLNDLSFFYVRTSYNLRMIRSMSVDKTGSITDTGNVKLLQIIKDKGVKITHQFAPGIYEFG